MTTSSVLREAIRPVGAPRHIAEDAFHFALDYCQGRVAPDQDPIERLKRNDGEAHSLFRYGLGLRLAGFIGELDGTVRAIYAGNATGAPEEIESEPIDLTTPLVLIVWVSRKTVALAALLEEVSTILTHRYRAAVSPQAAKLGTLIDAQIVDDRQVDERRGFGALLISFRERPSQFWRRR